MLDGFFAISHNVRDAVEQEYDLARKEYDEVCSYRNVFNKDHAEKFRAARERLNRARDLMFRVGAAMSKWADRKSDIERMVADGMTDAEIGLVYDRDGRVIYQVRRRFGILSNVKRISRSLRQVFAAQDPVPPPLIGETYIDEAGLTVTRYPARYAEGAAVQTVTARPRRG